MKVERIKRFVKWSYIRIIVSGWNLKVLVLMDVSGRRVEMDYIFKKIGVFPVIMINVWNLYLPKSCLKT